MLHLEPFITAAIASLTGGLDGAIAAENAKNADFAIPTVLPERILFGGEDPITKYPAIEVAAPEALIDSFSLGQVEWDMTVTLMVRAWLQNDDTVRATATGSAYTNLYKATMRMSRAIANVLLLPDAFGDHSVVASMNASYRTFDDRRELTAASLLTFKLADVEIPG